MVNYTHRNHLIYSIGGRDFGFRENSIEPFCVNVGSIDHNRYTRSNYADELRRTARLLYTDLGKDLVLFLSGGTDSEICARNFVEIGKKPDCIMIRFKDDYNLPDVIEAVAICDELGLKLTFIDFDVKDFFYSGKAASISEQIQCTQLTYLMVYSCILDIGRAAIMGGEALLSNNISKDSSSWYYTFRENEDASAMRFSEKFKIPFVNEYFSYTPELLLYYLENTDIQALTSDIKNYKLTSVSSKNQILKTLYPNIRAKKKTHGFEELLGFNYEAYKALEQTQIKRLEPSLDGIDIDTIINIQLMVLIGIGPRCGAVIVKLYRLY